MSPDAPSIEPQKRMPSVSELPAKDRLIVALDVKTVEAAREAVARLPNVSFFKIGYELFITGNLPTLLRELRGKRVFFDVKVPADITNTIAAVIDQCVEYQVTFLTLSDSMPPAIIRDARGARDRRGSEYPKLLTVPLISRLDETDFAGRDGEQGLETYILSRASAAVSAGCEGIIASGKKAIKFCRDAFPPPVLIVSPGIRPFGASSDEHKRLTTPARQSSVVQIAWSSVVPSLRIRIPKMPPTGSSTRWRRRSAYEPAGDRRPRVARFNGVGHARASKRHQFSLTARCTSRPPLIRSSPSIRSAARNAGGTTRNRPDVELRRRIDQPGSRHMARSALDAWTAVPSAHL